MRTDLGLILGAFLVATLLAVALGAPNTGQAFTFGMLALTATTVGVILRRP
jgi:hypothetical protein